MSTPGLGPGIDRLAEERERWSVPGLEAVVRFARPM